MTASTSFDRYRAGLDRVVSTGALDDRLIRTLDDGDAENLSMSEAQRQHYFEVGADALRIIVHALATKDRPEPAEILDFPSGSGRVTRYLHAHFPSARITAADLYESHVAFCADVFGSRGVVTPLDLAGFEFPNKYDVIFCGSLITHLPRRQARTVLELLARSLTPTGIAIVTAHGRRSDFLQANGTRYIADRKYRFAQAAAVVRGFGFVNYDAQFRRRFFNKQNSYGIALTRPWWTTRELNRLSGVRILGYSEMEWDAHQDVAVFGRPGVRDE